MSRFPRLCAIRASLVLVLLSLFSSFSFAQNPVTPPKPAILREVTGIIDYGDNLPSRARFQRPHIPAVRTTTDGRLGVFIQGGRSPKFTLLRPEALAQPVQLAPPLANVLDDSYSFVMSTRTSVVYQHPGASGVQESGIRGFTTIPWVSGLNWAVAHCALWETAPPYSNAQNQDVYSLAVVATINTLSGTRRTQFFSTPVQVVISNPKTATAAIASITVTGTPSGSGILPYVASGFEPVVAGDGRLFVLRVAAENMSWTNPNTGAQNNNVGRRDMVYVYYENGAICDASQWGDVIPITYAPFDNRINKKFGFARNAFRDAEGELIAPGRDFGASYPWIDRDAKNLFFEAVHDRLYQPGLSTQSNRYSNGIAMVEDPAGGTRFDPFFRSDQIDNWGNHQGVSFAGLWSRGKVVQLDNLLNDMDYGIGDRGNPTSVGGYPQLRRVELYEDDNNTATAYDGSMKLGYGRANRYMPPGANSNSNLIDSIENKLNLNRHAEPLTLRDIVWHGSVGKHTDDIVFDDYLDPDAFLVVHMNGALTWQVGVELPPVHGSSFKHHSGWNEQSGGWTEVVKLQNAAPADKADAADWHVPDHGLASSGVRLEPVANGGIQGKGLWLDGDENVTFDVPAQTRTRTGQNDWYVGLFLDARFADDSTERRILTFPDGTALSVLGRRQLLYSAGGTVVHRVTLPDAPNEIMPQEGWCHIALQIRDTRRTVDLHLNGILYDRWQDSGRQLFSVLGDFAGAFPTGGDLVLGSAGSNAGFHGWVDELRIFAHTLDLETACNLAGGTLCGVPDTASAVWQAEADRYPQWVHDEYASWLRNHGEAADAKFVCFHDYTADLTTNREAVAASGLNWRRESVLFPEGPLFHNAGRPESRHNAFCASCHFAQGDPGLTLDALKWIGTPAKLDSRRQPSQPPPLLHGYLPAGIVTNTDQAVAQPVTAIPLGTSSAFVDELMMNKYAGNASVQSFTLLDGKTGRDLAEIPTGALTTVDPVLLGTTDFRIRANLDSDQGAVHWFWNGGAKPDTNVAPHVQFANGISLTNGTYVLRATGDDGVQVVAGLTVLDVTAGAAPRAIASYGGDFRAITPKPGWAYWWNSLGPIAQPSTSLQRLAWSPVTNAYTSLGFAPVGTDPGRFVQCKATGGHPGGGINQGSAHGQTVHHYAVASYEIPFDGDYDVTNGSIGVPGGGGNGVRLWMAVDSAAGLSTGALVTGSGPNVFFDSNLVQAGPLALKKGDRIYVGVGPRGNDAFDSYNLNYTIRFVP